MVRSLAGQIEMYLKELLLRQDYIELQRSELAEIFSCVPSQINYVLDTRFTPLQGYVVESRRGGGGYLKIIKLSWDDLQGMQESGQGQLAGIPEDISQNEAQGIIKRLFEEDLITQREYQLLRMMISRDVLMGNTKQQDAQRARLIRGALTALCRMDVQDPPSDQSRY
jgi:transcriptional regulator CtsR